jgi:ligand-binding SRPBCC domain-containing protein
MRLIPRSPLLLYLVILGIPAGALLVTVMTGSQPRDQAHWFQFGELIFATGFVVLLAIAGFMTWSITKKPIDERAEERAAAVGLLALLFAIDALAFNQAPVSPALSLVATAAGAAWLAVWSSPRLRSTRFTTNYVIRSSPEVVFPFIADKRNLPKWWSEYESVEMLTTEPIGHGSRFRASVRIPPTGRKFVAEVELLEHEPNRRMTSFVSSGLRPNHDEYTFDLLDGATRVTYRFDFEYSLSTAGLGAVLLQFVPNGLQRASHERAQARIKQILESAPL